MAKPDLEYCTQSSPVDWLFTVAATIVNLALNFSESISGFCRVHTCSMRISVRGELSVRNKYVSCELVRERYYCNARSSAGAFQMHQRQ